jgi:hypothetical protein
MMSELLVPISVLGKKLPLMIAMEYLLRLTLLVVEAAPHR